MLAVTRFRGVLLRPLGHATAEQLTEPAAGHPNRWRAKKASSGAAHSRASTPPRTAGRWLSRRSRTTSHSDPTAPVLGSQAPNTSRAIRASTKAPAQISMVRAKYHHAVDAAEKKIKDVSKELLGQVPRFKVARKSVEELKKRVKVIKTFRGGAYRILDNALLATDLLLSPLSGNQLVHRPVSSL